MKIYDGGSNKDLEIYDGLYNITYIHYTLYAFVTHKLESDTVTSKGNQMFITFKTDGNGFTAKITFGNRIIL